VTFLKEAESFGYTVVVFFIGLSDPEVSQQRVAMRASQGGYDVPEAKLIQRFPRTLTNLNRSINILFNVFILDNSDLSRPYRWIARFERGKAEIFDPPLPSWLRSLMRE
jgi:predicted ABC-type ATPase